MFLLQTTVHSRDRLAQMVERSLLKNLVRGDPSSIQVQDLLRRGNLLILKLIGKSQFMSDIESSKNAIAHATFWRNAVIETSHLSKRVCSHKNWSYDKVTSYTLLRNSTTNNATYRNSISYLT